MTAPIKDWQKYKLGYVFGSKTFYSEHHFGVDFICPCGTPVFAPEAGKANHFIGSEAGRAIYLRVNASRIHRLMHLDTFLVYDGKWVSEGELLGYSGNTGLSTACHLHYDIFKGGELKIENFIDPLKELNNQNTMPTSISKGEFTELAWRYHGPKMKSTDIDWWWTQFETNKKFLSDIITEWDRSETAKNWRKEIEQTFEDQTKLKNQAEEVQQTIADLNICRIKLQNIKNIIDNE